MDKKLLNFLLFSFSIDKLYNFLIETYRLTAVLAWQINPTSCQPIMLKFVTLAYFRRQFIKFVWAFGRQGGGGEIIVE